MRPLPKQGRPFFGAQILFLAIMLLQASCISLGQQDRIAPATYIFEAALPLESRVTDPAATAVLLVSMPRAVAGYDTARMAYMRESGKIEYYRDHRWADRPGRMLHPLLVKALEESGAYRAVVMAPTAATTDLRLETEVLRLRQVFAGDGSSQLQLALRLQLIAADRVVATKIFAKTLATESADPQGGVAATNKALSQLLPEIARFGAASLHDSSPGP